MSLINYIIFHGFCFLLVLLVWVAPADDVFPCLVAFFCLPAVGWFSNPKSLLRLPAYPLGVAYYTGWLIMMLF